MEPLAVDLFAGTGSATAAFRAHGWRVLTIDRDARHRPDVVADVRSLPVNLGPDVGRPVDVLWMSPPCTEFSTANPGHPLRPSLELVFAALGAVRAMRPRFWVLENVVGAIPLLGIPAQKIGPFCLWGYFPLLEVTFEMNAYRKKAAGPSVDGFGDRGTAVARAAIPPAISEALYQSVARHWEVKSFMDFRPFRRHRHRAGRPDGMDQGLWEGR